MEAYFELLRPSEESDSEQIAQELKKLAEDIMLGRLRPELEGQESAFLDTKTQQDLYIVKAVDITDKCIPDDTYELEMKKAKIKGKREIILCYIPFSDGIICDIQDRYANSSISQAFTISKILSSDRQDDFKAKAEKIGIDPELLLAIIMANAPQRSLPTESNR